MKIEVPLKVDTHHLSSIKQSEPCGIVIFGASGDLAHRKIYPALYELFCAKRLPKYFFILGLSPLDWKDDFFRKEVLSSIPKKSDKKLQKEFVRHFYYRKAYSSDTGSFQALALVLKELEVKHKTQGNTIFYLAIPPEACGDIVSQLHQHSLIHPIKRKGPWTRIVFEKPFGHDLVSANKLNSDIHKFLDEEQIYRIDHYLGKETVQNILMFRFANTIFEPLWNREYIDHIQIMTSETLGVEHRAGYYEKAGALKDMFQNHMFQLLTLCAMEPPVKFIAEQYHDEKAKVLQALRPIPKGKMREFVVRGQYGSGVMDGKKAPGYRQEKGVNRKSNIETFVAMKLYIDNWRWHGVPFYLRSGKRLNSQDTEILIQFKQIPHSIFPSFTHEEFASNILCFRIQPDEGISLRFEAKRPGPEVSLASLNFDFNYENVFHTQLMSAYERLLLDCMHGDQMLFIREDVEELSWRFIARISEEWQTSSVRFPNYKSGSWGPQEANKLIESDGRKWRAYGTNYSTPTDERGKKL